MNRDDCQRLHLKKLEKLKSFVIQDENMVASVIEEEVTGRSEYFRTYPLTPFTNCVRRCCAIFHKSISSFTWLALETNQESVKVVTRQALALRVRGRGTCFDHHVVPTHTPFTRRTHSCIFVSRKCTIWTLLTNQSS